MRNRSKMQEARNRSWQLLVLLSTFLPFYLSTCLYAFQERLTEHRWYYALGGLDGKIYFLKHRTGYNFDLYRMNEDGSSQTQLTDDSLMECLGDGYDFFPDKTKAAITKTDGTYNYIYTANLDGTNAKSIYSTTGIIRTLKVSPDGNKIAFVETESDKEYGILCLINADGSGGKTLAPHIGLAPSRSPISAEAEVPCSRYFSPLRASVSAALNPRLHAPSFVPTAGSTVTQNNIQGWAPIAFSPDSTQIAFQNSNSYLTKIKTDGTGLTQLTTYYVDGPYWLKSNKIVITRDRQLATINPDGTGYTVLYSTTAHEFGFSVSPDESKIALNFYNEDEIVIISVSGEVIKEIPLPYGYYEYVNWVSDTKLLFGTWGGKDIFTINIDGTGFTNITKNDMEGEWVLLDAKGTKIVYGTEEKIYSMNTDGSSKTLLFTETETQDWYGMELSPDGSKLMYTLEEGATSYLYIRNSDGSGTPVKIEGPANKFYGSWSPDGSKIMYNYAGVHYICNPDGTGKKQLPGDNLLFSPDSTKIMFSMSSFSIGDELWNYSICTAPVDISTYTVILSTTISCYASDWQSNKVLLTEYIYSGYSLYSMNSDGSGLKLLDTGYDIWGELSPDGSKVAYIIYEDTSKNEKLYIINTDGTGKTKLAEGWGEFGWTSDSQKIAYTDYSGGLPKIYLANSDGSNVIDLNPSLVISWGEWDEGGISFVSGNKIVYMGDLDIWVGDYDPTIQPKIELKEEDKGEIKIIGGTESKGTVNPDKGENVKIDFRSDTVGKFECKIFTLTGELVYEETKDNMSSGRFEWIPKDIASGIYVVSIKGPGVNVHKKVAILR
ncbi:MAG: hypothetical protein AB1349_07250 [Elusimicrobiota bacterium]